MFQYSDGRTEAGARLAVSVCDIECAQPPDNTSKQNRIKNICTPCNTGIRDISGALPPGATKLPTSVLEGLTRSPHESKSTPSRTAAANTTAQQDTYDLQTHKHNQLAP